MCSCQPHWICHDWGLYKWPTWEGGQVFKASLSPSSSSFCPRYDSEGRYLSSLPDLATPRYHHGCATLVSATGEKVKILTILTILFQTGLDCCWRLGRPLYSLQHGAVLPFKQRLDNRRKPSQVEIFFKSFEFNFVNSETQSTCDDHNQFLALLLRRL